MFPTFPFLNPLPPNEQPVLERVSMLTNTVPDGGSLPPSISYSWIPLEDVAITPSAMHQSVAGETKILEDYPALLSYAVFEMFTHARLAKNMEPIRRLSYAAFKTPSIGSGFDGLLWLSTFPSVLGSYITPQIGACSRGRPECGIIRQKCPPLGGTNGKNAVEQVLPGDGIVESAKRQNSSAFDFLLRHSRGGEHHRLSLTKGIPVLQVLAGLADVVWIREFLSRTMHREHASLVPVEESFINSRDCYGRTALQIAVEYKNIDIVAELLRYGASPNTRRRKAYLTLLHLACASWLKDDLRAKSKAPNHEIVKLLLESGAKVDVIDGSGNTALHIACDNIPEVEQPEEPEDRYGSENEGEWTKGVEKEISSSVKIVNLLLRFGVDPNLVNEEEETALYMTCRSGSNSRRSFASRPNAIVIIEQLLDSGANSSISNRFNMPLHKAAKRQSREIVASLVRHGDSLEASTL